LAVWVLVVRLAAQPPAPAGPGVDGVEGLVAAAMGVAEKSVVQVARIGTEPAVVGTEPAPFPLVPGHRGVAVSDGDAVPHEVAAGVAVAKNQVVTRYHVIGDSETSRYVVWSGARAYAARLLAADPWFDLAILQTDEGGLTPIALGDGGQVRPGQIVVALGDPRAASTAANRRSSWGVVAGLLERAPRASESTADALGRQTVHHYGTLIQTTAPLDPGFDGGALVDAGGRMVGLLTAWTAEISSADAAGFAIPVDQAFHRVVRSLGEGKLPEYGLLGVWPEPLDEEMRRAGRRGAAVARVLPGTPAARAGVRPADIIRYVNGHPVRNDEDLIRLIGLLPPGAQVRLGVVRDGSNDEPEEVVVVLAKKSVATDRPAVGEAARRAWRGLRVDYATAITNFEEVAELVGRVGGVMVVEVREGSAAGQAGLRAGQLITQVAGRPVSEPADFEQAVAEADQEVRIEVVDPQGQVSTRTVSP
jgi:serine protease Do